MEKNITRREALRKIGQGTAIGTLAATVGSDSAVAGTAHPDAELLALGTEFDRQFTVFKEVTSRANAKYDAFMEKRGGKVPKDGTEESVAFWSDYRRDVDVFITEQDVAGTAVDHTAKLIKELPAASFAGMAVKARTLRHHLCKWGENPCPIEDWDWDEECLERFIREVEAMASDDSGWRA